MAVDSSDAQLKIYLRQRALAGLGAEQASVLDLFCGQGGMYKAVWSRAHDYLGVDKKPGAGLPAWKGDNQRLLARALEQAQPNLVDLDAYGSPWPLAMAVLRQAPIQDRLLLVATCGIRISYAGPDAPTRRLLGWPDQWFKRARRLQGAPSLIWRWYPEIVRRYLALGMGERWKCERLEKANSRRNPNVAYWLGEFRPT